MNREEAVAALEKIEARLVQMEQEPPSCAAGPLARSAASATVM